MESIQQIMSNPRASTILGFKRPQVIRRYRCNACGSEVKVIKAIVLGEEKVIDHCVSCDYRRIAEDSVNEFKRAQIRKMQAIFEQESLINDDLKAASFDNYQPRNESQLKAKQEAMRYVAEFALDKPQNLLLAGSYGVGKSHLAVSIAKKLHEAGYSSVFISVPRLFTKIKSTFGRREGMTEDEIMEALARVDCLILDDIGAEHIDIDRNGEGRGWGVAKIFEIVDSRAGKHTVYTTNLTSDEMMRRFGMRNFSRLMKNTKAITVDGEDYRLREFREAAGNV